MEHLWNQDSISFMTIHTLRSWRRLLKKSQGNHGWTFTMRRLHKRSASKSLLMVKWMGICPCGPFKKTSHKRKRQCQIYDCIVFHNDGQGPLLTKKTSVDQFLARGVVLCLDENGPARTGHYCGGWLKDKVTYASTHFIGVDEAKNVYDASPGHWGFWPEMLLPFFQSTELPQGGFWWQLAIQLPGGRGEFIKVQYYRLAEAIRRFMLDFMRAYKKEWGLVQRSCLKKSAHGLLCVPV